MGFGNNLELVMLIRQTLFNNTFRFTMNKSLSYFNKRRKFIDIAFSTYNKDMHMPLFVYESINLFADFILSKVYYFLLVTLNH